MWYILICVNDVLIIVGSFLKVGLESKVSYFLHMNISFFFSSSSSSSWLIGGISLGFSG